MLERIEHCWDVGLKRLWKLKPKKSLNRYENVTIGHRIPLDFHFQRQDHFRLL